MNLLHKFLPRIDFESYEDFKQNYKLNVPDRFNFAYDVVDEYARLQPDKPALVWCNDNDNEDRHLSFGEISQLSSQTANVYRSLGIKKGDPVMLILKQRVEVWACILALCKIGAICICASFQLTEKDIIYRCNAAGVKMITAVDDEEILKHIANSLADSPTVERVGVVGKNIPEEDIYIDFRCAVKKASTYHPRPVGKDDTKIGDPMLIYFSSGTTGMPKMIMHDFSFPLGHIVTAKYWQQVEDEGLHLTVSDSGWAKFAWGKIYGQWIAGAVVVAYDTDKFNAANLLKTICRLHLTTFCAPPTVYRFLIKEDLSTYDFSSIHHCGIAGEPLNPEVYHRFMEATGLEVREGFGQSETSVLIANFPWIKVKPGSTGMPSPLYDLDIIDENGNPCEDGVVGSIVIKNTDKRHPIGLFRCYYRDTDAMKHSWTNGVYNTGDMAWRDSDGYLWFEGRNDDVIKCSGYRIGPFEVESVLMTHPSVLECAVTAIPDSIRGQVVKATIVLARGYHGTDTLKKELQNHVKKMTAPYKYPRVVKFVEELPKTISGKIRRAEIRKNDSQKKCLSSQATSQCTTLIHTP